MILALDEIPVLSQGTMGGQFFAASNSSSHFEKFYHLKRLSKDTSKMIPNTGECINDQYNYAKLKGCLCQVIQSGGADRMSFEYKTNTNFQQHGTNCVIYTFVGDVNELVRVEIVKFETEMSEPIDHSTRCLIYMRIFSELQRAELNLNDMEDHELCANNIDGKQSIFYSSGRVLMIEIVIHPNMGVFHILGNYKFDNKNWYKTDGIPIRKSTCDIIFMSPRYQTTFPNSQNEQFGGLVKSEGQFFSPQYPMNYPKSCQCVFYFIGHPDETVRLSLVDIVLPEISDCELNDKATRIVISEPKTNFTFPPESNGAVDAYNGSIRQTICQSTKMKTIESLGPTLVLHFYATSLNHTSKGFRGRFQFISDGMESQYQHGNFKEIPFDAWSNAQSEQSYTDADLAWTTHIHMNPRKPSGTIQSPFYPKSYPDNHEHHYVFHIPVGRQLRLELKALKLGNHQLGRCDQIKGDRIEMFNKHDSEEEPNTLTILCGTVTAVGKTNDLGMVNKWKVSGPVFVIRFISDSVRMVGEEGFVISYAFEPIYFTPTTVATPKGDENLHSDESSMTEEEPCQFIISSKGQPLSGRLDLNKFLPVIGQSQFDRLHYSGCHWHFQGDPGQRIQVKLVNRRSIHSALPLSISFLSSNQVQHDQQPLIGVNGLSNIPPLLTHLRCQSAMSLELVGYHSLTKANQQTAPNNPTFHAALHPSSYIPSTLDYPFQNAPPTDDFIASDPFRICADQSAATSTAAKGFMSGSIPRMDVILKVDNQIAESNFNRHAHSDYDIEYNFVRDYGVIAQFGEQIKPACRFEFNRFRALRGNFSSPNYPGLYPIDLECEYRFVGHGAGKIDIDFFEFDVESASKSCADDRMGDHIEFQSCGQVEFLKYPKRRLCHQLETKPSYHIEWYEPCLLIKFFSNSKFVASGFFGQYTFRIPNHCPRSRMLRKDSIIFILLWINFISY